MKKNLNPIGCVYHLSQNIKSMQLIFAAVLLISSCVVCAKTAIPKMVFLQFEISTSGITVGTNTEIFKRSGLDYEIISTTNPKGIASLFLGEIHRISKGKVTPAGLKPKFFEERGRYKGKRSANFDWINKSITLTNASGIRKLTMSPNTIDQAGFLFSFLVKPPRKQIEISLTDGIRLKRYKYIEKNTERITTPAGVFNTLRLIKVITTNDQRKFEIWLSNKHDYLPVKIKFTNKKGRSFESILNKISIEYD